MTRLVIHPVAAKRIWKWQGFFEDVIQMIEQTVPSIKKISVYPEWRRLDIGKHEKIKIEVEINSPSMQERHDLTDLLTEKLIVLQEQQYNCGENSGGIKKIRIAVE